MSHDAAPVRFGRFQLDAARRVLLFDGRPAKLSARAVDVLVALVERRDRVVGKDELFRLVWPNLVVEENNLQVHVSALRKLLGAESIVTVPGRGYQFVAPTHRATTAAPTAAQGPGHVEAPAARPGAGGDLPAQPPVLFGRDRDIAIVQGLLREHRIVTLVGPPGIGKTVLAAAVACRVHADHADGVWWVDLAAVRDPALVVSSLCRTLGIGMDDPLLSAETVGAALRDQSLLLVFDNCEHLLADIAPVVQALVRRAPRLRLLATSQERLRLPDEQVHRLDPLGVADVDLEGAARSGAVQLFVARAGAVAGEFALTADNLAVVGEICRRLDGLPLAIELAAARLPLLGLEGIRSRMDERWRLLAVGARAAPTRHRTLRAAFEWSHDLLSPAEQVTLRRLGVFLGGFSLPLAQRVAADDRVDAWQVLEHLGALVDKSLVVTLGAMTPRYHLLETTRAFALDHLRRSGEVERVRQAHASALRQLFETSDRAVAHADDYLGLMRGLELELDNLRAALAWAIDGAADRETAVALVATSDWLWNETDLWREGWQWCQKVLPWVGDSLPTRLQARFWITAAGLGRVTMQPAPQWVGWAQRAAGGFRACRDALGLYRALCLLGQSDAGASLERVGDYLDEAARIEDPAWSPRLRLRLAAAREYWHHLGGRLVESREAGRRHVELAHAAGGVVEVAALTNLADSEWALGNHDAAIELCRAAIARAGELGRGAAAVHAYAGLVPVLLEQGRLEEAAAALRAGRDALVRAIGSAFSLLPYLPWLAHAHADHRLAALLLGCAERTYRRSGRVMQRNERGGCDRLLADLRSKLPPALLAALLDEGAEWSEDDAFARAGAWLDARAGQARP